VLAIVAEERRLDPNVRADATEKLRKRITAATRR
jgi:hypothetical protein